MKTPRIVAFDLGKVLLDFDYRIVIEKTAPRCAASVEQLQDLICQSPLLHQYETGLLTTSQFFSEIQRASGFRGSLEEFADLFGDIFCPIEPMVQLQASLRGQGVPTCIFSNTNELAILHVRRTYPFFSGFDHYIFSCEQRAMKPAPKIYEALEQISGCQGAEIAYIDDRPENIEAGLQRGWQVILQETPEKTRRRIVEMGLLSA